MSCGGKVAGCIDVTEKDGALAVLNRMSFSDRHNIMKNRGESKQWLSIGNVVVNEWDDPCIPNGRSFTIGTDKVFYAQYNTNDGEITISPSNHGYQSGGMQLTVYGKDIPWDELEDIPFVLLKFKDKNYDLNQLKGILDTIKLRDQWTVNFNVNLPVMNAMRDALPIKDKQFPEVSDEQNELIKAMKKADYFFRLSNKQ